MHSAPDRVFISYARADLEVAQQLTSALRFNDVNVWFDVDDLKPSANWQMEIQEAILKSRGIVVIVSSASLRAGALSEIRIAQSRGVPLVAVAVGGAEIVPPELGQLPTLVVRLNDLESFDQAAKHIRAWSKRNPGGSVDRDFASRVSEHHANVAKHAGAQPSELGKRSVFVVHGHDEEALSQLRSFLSERGVRAVVLKDIEDPDVSLLKRFLTIAEDAAFAVALLTPDDFGASRLQYGAPKGGENALRYRSRQNVILELGFFLGKLGFEKVFVLRTDPTEHWPPFELPSDLEGAVYKKLDSEGRWQRQLEKALREAGVIAG